MNSTNELISSDQRHNHNSYAYLQQLSPFINDTVLKILPKFESLISIQNQPYNAKIAYGDYYTFFLSHLETQIDSIYPSLTEEQRVTIDDLIFSVYHNDNHIMDSTNWLKKLNTSIRPQKSNAETLIAKSLKDKHPAINKSSPKKAESLIGRLFTLFTPNFKPQLDTNIPSIRHYSHLSDLPTIEYRFGTQGQRHHGQARVSPLFTHWLAIKAKRTASEQRIDHIYFNNMGLDRESMDIPGSNEKELSHALHQLENNTSLKIAVITFPASHGLMNTQHYKKEDKPMPYLDAFAELFAVARYEKHPNGVVDFKISPQIRALLFSSPADETLILKQLLHKSFAIMGVKPEETLSVAQKQAVWLHFIKFELTHYILSTLKPKSCNFSCKDAIDRGTLSSLYYNLHLSFLLKNPMSRDEFEQNIDISAANVKGRGMNFQRRVLWNALNTFIQANYLSLLNDKQSSWLIYWRDMNCPHSRVKELLELRLKECELLLNTLPSEQTPLKTEVEKLLASVKMEYKQQVNGQRLLLEVISRTAQFLSEKPSVESIKAYKNLAKELEINHPCLLIIAGIMLTLLGALLLSHQMINQGVSKIKSGFFVSQRKELCDSISAIALENQSRLTE